VAIGLDPKQIVSFEELLMPQVIQQEALIKLLVEKRIFSKEEFLEMVRVVNLEIQEWFNNPRKKANPLTPNCRRGVNNVDDTRNHNIYFFRSYHYHWNDVLLWWICSKEKCL
jgi:hypothetical protein